MSNGDTDRFMGGMPSTALISCSALRDLAAGRAGKGGVAAAACGVTRLSAGAVAIGCWLDTVAAFEVVRAGSMTGSWGLGVVAGTTGGGCC